MCRRSDSITLTYQLCCLQEEPASTQQEAAHSPLAEGYSSFNPMLDPADDTVRAPSPLMLADSVPLKAARLAVSAELGSM